MKETLTTLLLPKGEWLDSMLVAFEMANLELYAKPRSYEYTFINQALPIVFQALRSKEVPQVIADRDTSVYAGFTGTDIAAEQRVRVNGTRNWEFPLNELNPDAPKPRVYLGSTPILRGRVNNPGRENLGVANVAGTTIYTEYPYLTARLLRKNSVVAKIKPVQGGSEGRWRIDPNNGAIVTIRNTDATMKANQIEPMQEIMSAGVVYLENPLASEQDRGRVDDLRELIFLALRGK
jgi:ATP phosphoribosyltransferase